MYIIGTILLFVIGYLAVFNLSTLTTRLERVGLAFPVGTGLVTVIMALMDMVRIPLTGSNLIIADLVVTAALVGWLATKRGKVFQALKRPVDFNSFNFVWLLLLAFVAWVEYTNFSKCMFFPVYDRDSLAAFDTLGFVAAQEHTYGAMSIFTGDYMPSIHQPGSVIAYFPLVQLSYAYVYALGAETSKVIPAFIYLSFLVAFYAVLTRATSRTVAMAATMFVVLTPEMVSFSSLSGVNVIDAVYASLGLIYVFMWLGSKSTPQLALGSLLLALNVWCRAEGVVFVLVAGLVVLCSAVRRRKFKPLLIIAATLVPVVIWKVFTSVFGMNVDTFVITHPFFDGEKAGRISDGIWELLKNQGYYGWTFVAFLLAVIADIWFMVKRKSNDLVKLVGIVAALLLYMLILYHVDYKWDSIDNVLRYSAKRFMFCFVPLAWYFIATCTPVAAVMKKFDAWMAK